MSVRASLRGLGRRAAARSLALVPPWLARPAGRAAGLALRDVGRTRHSAATMSHALRLITDVGGTTQAQGVPVTVAQIAARMGRSEGQVARWAELGLLGAPLPGTPPSWVGGVERARLVVYLLHRGLGLDELAAAASENRLALLIIDRAIAGRGRYTIGQAARRAGVDQVFAERVIRALGVSTGEVDDRIYNRVDVRSLRILGAVRSLYSDDELLDALAVQGRGMAQIAAAQVELVRHVARRFIESGVGELESALRIAALVDLLRPAAAVTLVVAHRRHLEIATQAESIRRLEEERGRLPGQEDTAVGFADLVGYTAASERLSARELGELSSALMRAAEASFPSGVRIVKSIGDAVMFAARTPEVAAAAALALVERLHAEGHCPALHVGIAYGPALRRHADYFGRTVTIAARLCEAAGADEVLVHLGEVAVPAAGAVALVEAGTRSLDGIAQPVPVHRVERRTPEAGRPPA